MRAAPVIAQSSVSSLWLWILILMAVVVAGAVVIFKVRRSLLSGDDPKQTDMGLMAQLDAMRRSGELSEEEYRHARASLLDRAGLMGSAGDEPDQTR